MKDVPLIEWGVAARAFSGCDESGDQYLVESFPDGTLVTVVDGLGHGPRAAVVAKAAIAALEGHSHEAVVSLLKRCHNELKGTRGVVMSLASFNAQEKAMTWLGVGNVQGLLLSTNGNGEFKHEWLLARGGVVGYQLPSLRPISIPITQGDTLILATDGLRSGFSKQLPLGDSPQQIADHILAQYGRGTDDAMVLVARYAGERN
jgi:serine phosphatase RsbU (regulator of sigma subunit)